MNPKAVEKARVRLAAASAALDEFESAVIYGDLDARWYLFLMAAKSVYTALEQGAKASPQSMQWFGAKKNERRADPLLQYLFQARDDDEHGLERVTERVPPRTLIGDMSPGGSRSFSIHVGESTDDISVTTHDGKPIRVWHENGYVRLAEVTGRGGVKYPPPTEHKGDKLAENLPAPVGRLALDHLAALIAEAEGLS